MQYYYHEISLCTKALVYKNIAWVEKRLCYVVESDLKKQYLESLVICCRLPIQNMCLDAHEYSFPINAHRVVINYIQEKSLAHICMPTLFGSVVFVLKIVIR